MFNVIPIEENPETPINPYKYQCCGHMIINGMSNILYLPEPFNQEKKRDIILNKYIFLWIKKTPHKDPQRGF